MRRIVLQAASACLQPAGCGARAAAAVQQQSAPLVDALLLPLRQSGGGAIGGDASREARRPGAEEQQQQQQQQQQQSLSGASGGGGRVLVSWASSSSSSAVAAHPWVPPRRAAWRCSADQQQQLLLQQQQRRGYAAAAGDADPGLRIIHPELGEHDYHARADAALDALHEALEGFVEDLDLNGGDVEHAQGVLTVNLGRHGTYVINKQAPNRQLWLSSPVSGPFRYDHVPGKGWVYARDGRELFSQLRGELEQLLGSAPEGLDAAAAAAAAAAGGGDGGGGSSSGAS